MDILRKRAYVRLKLFGNRDTIDIDADGGLSKNIQEAMRCIMQAPNRYGRCTIEFDFEPFNRVLNEMEQHRSELYGMIDMSLVEMATDEEEELANRLLRNSPMNKDSATYDPLYEEYQMCSSPTRRSIKTPHDLALLRKHMEDNYRETEWWDGSHRW